MGHLRASEVRGTDTFLSKSQSVLGRSQKSGEYDDHDNILLCRNSLCYAELQLCSSRSIAFSRDGHKNTMVNNTSYILRLSLYLSISFVLSVGRIWIRRVKK